MESVVVMKDCFYLRDSRADVGSNCQFWSIKGYTSNVSDAQVFSRKEAQVKFNARPTDMPLSKEHVDKLTRLRVDHQYVSWVDIEDILELECYYIVKRNYYDGNDIFFSAEVGFTYDFINAKVFTGLEIKNQDLSGERYFFFEKIDTQFQSRLAFPSQSINKRKMIQGAGIVQPKVKKCREYYRCENCGKFVSEDNYFTQSVSFISKCKKCK